MRRFLFALALVSFSFLQTSSADETEWGATGPTSPVDGTLQMTPPRVIIIPQVMPAAPPPQPAPAPAAPPAAPNPLPPNLDAIPLGMDATMTEMYLALAPGILPGQDAYAVIDAEGNIYEGPYFVGSEAVATATPGE